MFNYILLSVILIISMFPLSIETMIRNDLFTVNPIPGLPTDFIRGVDL